MGNLFLGIFYNLSFWYKLTNRTVYGALFSVIGASITIALNVILIPTIGYYGSAWAAFAAYFVMMIMSYLIGKKYFPVPYQIQKIIFYLLLSAAIYFLSINLGIDEGLMKYIVNTFLLMVFLSLVLFTEKRSLTSLFKKRKHN
jgi:Na+-driven multidrug efflux pump